MEILHTYLYGGFAKQPRVYRLPCHFSRSAFAAGEGPTCLDILCVHRKTRLDVELYNIWKALPVFRYNYPIISIRDSIYKICISMFFTHKCEGHFTNTSAQIQTAEPVQYNNQDTINASQCCTTLALDSITVTNGTVLCRAHFASNIPYNLLSKGGRYNMMHLYNNKQNGFNLEERQNLRPVQPTC
jgi:hypothetical protein